MVRATRVVLVVRALRLDSRLTPLEDWITTTVHAQVVDVIKNTATLGLSQGAMIEIPQDDGEVTVDGKTIRAITQHRRLPRPGQTYLYFFSEHRGALYPASREWSFELGDTDIKRLQYSFDPAVDINRHVDPTAVLAAARLAARTQR
jgi:hypothetical protein